MTKVYSLSVLLSILAVLFAPTSIFAESHVIEFPENANYSFIPFDITLNKLPPNYFGHNAKIIYDTIQAHENTQGKDEFETAEQYRERIIKESNIPITGSLFYNSLLAFYLDGLATLDDDILYDTAKSSFRIYLRLGTVLERFEFVENRRAISSRKSLLRDSYYAMNTFGATAKVEKTSWISYDIEFKNWQEFPIEKLGLSKHGMQIYAIKGEVFVGINEAKKLKNNKKIRAIAICKLTPPYLTWGGMIEKPTLNSPKDYSSIMHYINAKLYEIWFYDFGSGKILGKVKR